MNESTSLNTYGYNLSDPDEYQAFLWQRQFGWMYQPLGPEPDPPRPRPLLQRQNAQIIDISDSSEEEEEIIDEDDIEIYIDPSIICEDQ